MDKWTVGLNKWGLYNRVKPPEEEDQKNIKEKHWGRFTVALGRTPSEIANLSNNLLIPF